MSIKNKTERAKLQRLINKTAEAATRLHNANAALCAFCMEKYGVEPGDVDCDAVIDSVQGGTGTAEGMSAEDFDAAMTESIERNQR